MAVIAGALEDATAAQVIDAAVADVRPVGRVALHDAGRTGRARALFERQRATERHDGLMRAAQLQVQEAERIEHRLRRVPESLDQQFRRRLGRQRAVGVSAHAVDDHQQCRFLRHCDGAAILVVFPPADQAEVCIVDAQVVVPIR
jgi:hypothetical protein